MIQKSLSLVMVLAMVLLALAGCSGGSGGSGGSQSSEGGVAQNPGGASGGTDDYSWSDLLDKSWEEIEALAKEEGEIIYAVWGDEPEWNLTAAAFEEQYGIKVNIVTGEKIAVMNKVIAELEGNGTIDVMMLAGETVTGLIGADALVPDVLDKLEHKDQLVEGLSLRKEGVSNERGYWAPINVNPGGIFYNTNNIENPPQTWAEFEQYIDENPLRFGFCLPEKGGTGQAMMEAVIANLTGGLDQYLLDETVDPDKHAGWDVVWEWVNSRKDRITFTNSNSDSITRLNGGELDLVVAWNTTAAKAVQNGEIFAHWGFYAPEFGLCYSGDTIAALQNAPNPAASLLWINWLTGEEAQRTMAQYLEYCPARVDLDLDVSLLSPGELEKNVEWMSSVYKTQYIADFTQNVLQ